MQAWEAAAGFVGRADEVRLVHAAIADAVAGRPNVVYLEGVAGAGKTTLVRHALAGRGDDLTIVWADADELTSTVPFGVVAQWTPVASLDAAAVGAGLVRWIADLQREGPVILVVEDLQWCDGPSRSALLSAVRRLGSERVLLLVTARPGGAACDDGWQRARTAGRFRHVELAGLTVEEVRLLAERCGVALARRHVERLHRHTAGHALYVRTLLGELSGDQLTSPTVDLPAPRSLASTTVAVLAAMTPEGRDLAGALAVLGGAAPLALVVHVAGVAEPACHLEQLLATGFIEWQPHDPLTPLRFTHPLHGSAVYGDLSPGARQRFHGAAAEVVDRFSALRHRVAATGRPDDALAAELEEAAHDVQDLQNTQASAGRASGARAAQFLQWAADCSVAAPDRDRRRLRAARSLIAANEITAALALTPLIEAGAPSPQRDHVLGTLAWHQGDATGAERQLRRAADCGGATAAEALVDLARCYAVQRRGVEAQVAAQRALGDPHAPQPTQRAARALVALGVGLARGPVHGLAVLDGHLPADAALARADDASLLCARGMLRLYAGRPSRAVSDLEAAVRLARSGVAVEQLHRCHLHLAVASYVLGDWDAADVHIELALDLIIDADDRWDRAPAHATACLVAAGRGRWEVCARHATAVRAAAAVVPTRQALASIALCSAAQSRARGDVAGVVEALAPLLGNDLEGVPELDPLGWWAALIEALIDTGDCAGADRQLSAFQSVGAERATDVGKRAAALRASLAGARGEPQHALELFEEAMAAEVADDPLLDRAGIRHRHGRLLLATGRRRAALGQLRHARALYASVGAVPFVGRVDVDLANAGLATAPGGTSPLALTDRERDVATLVATGRTNREVAGELFVSEKAVEFHLRNIFGKFGISSRRQLRGRIGLVTAD